jgi:hypothetical protein
MIHIVECVFWQVKVPKGLHELLLPELANVRTGEEPILSST